MRPGELAVCDPKPEILQAIQSEWPAVTCVTSADALCGLANMVILAVKPYLAAEVIDQCGDRPGECPRCAGPQGRRQ